MAEAAEAVQVPLAQTQHRDKLVMAVQDYLTLYLELLYFMLVAEDRLRFEMKMALVLELMV
jgi:hypothetical protein